MVVKKEYRTSLGELFQRTKIEEENSASNFEKGEKRADKETTDLPCFLPDVHHCGGGGGGVRLDRSVCV
ncbi:hypothetical protein Vadar_029074 [Vaccinium darrowii]|uniref:Uncharacterized protein n=1 Tax=Vaccinium darrowii TaxID=229202 RepID=A0ACB7Y9E6_9ERIC|nr:hypothetical protein Vadar_029074 [Vaccinium darrowii]